ncbi:MAG: isochorismatase family protein [Candidatus Heimdallarchaeota archaeon]|nr:isochorismatase family protein [Candidatus Heimdallarchaeota archaeon]
MTEISIIEEWPDIELPDPPVPQEISVNVDDTALLLLDIQNNNCNEDRRLRCAQRVEQFYRPFLLKARKKSMTIVYSLTSSAEVKDIREEVKPIKNEPVVKSSVDKFRGTELEEILKSKGIKKVIIIGTSAEGAVLNTATGASLRGFEVIVPIEGVSSSYPYAEQYTIWHLMNSPGTRRNTKITRINWIKIQ